MILCHCLGNPSTTASTLVILTPAHCKCKSCTTDTPTWRQVQHYTFRHAILLLGEMSSWISMKSITTIPRSPGGNALRPSPMPHSFLSPVCQSPPTFYNFADFYFASPLSLTWINFNPVWISYHMPCKVWNELLIHSQTSTVPPFKFWNGYVISPNIL